MRDRWGIPHITAQNDNDAWFGLGFCQGQDRTFQLETRLRMGRGLLSGLVGKQMLPIDRLSRRIGFRRAAKGQLAALDTDLSAQLNAFCAGVTSGAADGRTRAPLEFAILRSSPTPYEPADVLANLGIISFMLASNWDSELARLEILRADGRDALTALEADYPSWLDTTDPATAAGTGDAIDRLRDDALSFLQAAGLGAGSNNWAISGSRTRSGRALLANDPHLSPDLPPHWYLAHITTPGWEAAGAALAGTPGFAAGHNQHVAWGVTAGCIDNTDLFIEDLSSDGSQARGQSGWEPTQQRTENIPVRGGRNVSIDITETDRGPVVSPDLSVEGFSLSMRATWLLPSATRGILTVHHSQNVTEIKDHFASWPGLPLNIVAADHTGDIGWNLVGDTPVRGVGQGLMPVPAWVDGAGWGDALVPAAELPGATNPDDGILATANNKPTNNDTPWLTHDWLDASRVNRIRQVLSERHDWDVESTRALQLDRVTLVWAELSELVADATVSTPAGSRAHDLLLAWNGDSLPDSAAAAVFELLVAELALRMTRAKAPNSAEWACGASAFGMIPAGSMGSRRIMHLVDTARTRPVGWFDHGWPVETGLAIDRVAEQLVAAAGPDPSRWTWGELRPLELRHPLGVVGPLAALFNRGPFPWGGSAHTINNGAVDLLQPLSNPYAVASLRMVVEVPDWDGATFSLPGGQSGDPASPHYDDLLAEWLKGGGVPIAWTKESVDAATIDRMRLLPS